MRRRHRFVVIGTLVNISVATELWHSESLRCIVTVDMLSAELLEIVFQLFDMFLRPLELSIGLSQQVFKMVRNPGFEVTHGAIIYLIGTCHVAIACQFRSTTR